MSTDAYLVVPNAQGSGERVLARGRAIPRRACDRCGHSYRPKRAHQRYCEDACRVEDWKQRQAALDFEPAPAPLPPVVDQRVPAAEQRRLCRMAATILDELRNGPALASALHGLFPGSRSVRTRISDVGRYLKAHGQRLHSEPVAGMVGEWRYWIEDVR